MFRPMVRVAIIVLVCAVPVMAANWPQFRGPNGTGVAEGHALPDQIQPGQELWKAFVPSGHSSPVVVSGHVYVTAADGEDLLTIAFDVRNGKELWRRQAPRDRTEHLDKRNSPASPSPVSDSD
jgi:outer membrane protein assembly factor BamB